MIRNRPTVLPTSGKFCDAIRSRPWLRASASASALRHRAVDFRHEFVLYGAQVDGGLRRIAAGSATALLGRDTVAAATDQLQRTIETFAVGAAIGVLANRIEIGRIAQIRRARADANRTTAGSHHDRGRGDVGWRRARNGDGIDPDAVAARDGGIDPRRHRGIDGGYPRVDVEARRAHDALRMRHRGNSERQQRRRQDQRRAPRHCAPIQAIVDHGTSANSGTRHLACGTASLTVSPPRD